MRSLKRFVLGAVVVLAIFAAGPSATAGPGAQTVTVRLREFKVVPSVAGVRAGRVTFVARNVGRLPHDLVVLRTNLAPSRLPLVGTRAKEVGRQGKTAVFGAGQTRRLTLTLRPGKHVLICNVPGHYRAGMFVGFRVR